MKTYSIILLPLIFLLISIPIFELIYRTTKSIIDEEFHLRQGLHFCHKHFDVWDPKITTFPGLYLLTVLLGPFGYCNVHSLRAISLACGTSNIVLIYKIKRSLSKVGVASGGILDSITLDSICLALVPPIYFFNHVYYTDALSLTTVLLFYWCWLKEKHLTTSIFAAASVLVRQTNIVWVVMLFGITALNTIIESYAATKGKNSNIDFFNIMTYLDVLTSPRLIITMTWKVLRKCYYYLLVILPFIVFIMLNGSIVLGDKRAHVATLHVPQLFYFILFTLLFSPSHLLRSWRLIGRYLQRHKFILLAIGMISLGIVHLNTLEHPYLLSDNRHYTFYLWQRLYRRYRLFKYAVVPFYVFGLALISLELQASSNGSFNIMFALCTFIALCLQRLLDVRYFFIPFVLYRLETSSMNVPRHRWAQGCELIYFALINIVVFYIFFTKEIIWQDFKEPQRLIW